MNLHEIHVLDRISHWLDELIAVCCSPGEMYARNNRMVADVTRKAKALRTVLKKLRDFLDGKKE